MREVKLVLESQAPDDYCAEVLGKVPEFEIGGVPQTKEWMVLGAVEEHFIHGEHRLYYDEAGLPAADNIVEGRIVARVSFWDV